MMNPIKPANVLLLGLGLLLPTKPALWAQAVPHHFTDISLESDHTIILGLGGNVSNLVPGLSSTISNQFMQMFDLYTVEAATNLVDWTRLALLVRTNNNLAPLLFQDSNAAGYSQRFYRTLTNHLITGFPQPTGPFSVGTADRILTDPSRTNRYGIKTNSSFMSTFWYPAEPPGPGILPGAYNERAVAGDRSFYSFWGWSVQWTNIVPQFVAYSLREAPLASGQNRFPVILLSHGWTCDRRLNSQTAEELASHGYIVAAVDHEDCHATVFPDARGARYVPPGTVGYDSASVRSRTNDIQCLLRELGPIDSTDSLLAGRLDLDRIGMMGMSFGGGTAAETGRLDSRVKCVALLDAFIDFANYSALNSQGLQKPFLAMNRTILDHSDRLIDLSPASQRLYTLATTDATWLKIAKAGHFSFSDCAWTVEMSSNGRQAALAIDACLQWFFDTYLKGETPSFPTNPEITNVQRK